MSEAPKRKRLRWIALGLIVLGGAVCAVYAGNYRFIQDKDALYRVPKAKFGFEQTYVDTREWGPKEFAENREIAKQLVRAKGSKALDELGDAVKDLGEALKNK